MVSYLKKFNNLLVAFIYIFKFHLSLSVLTMVGIGLWVHVVVVGCWSSCGLLRWWWVMSWVALGVVGIDRMWWLGW